MAEFCPFKANFTVLGLYFPKATMNLLNFWDGSCSYGPLCENHNLYAGKILIWRNFGHLRPKFGHFWPKLTVLRVFDL